MKQILIATNNQNKVKEIKSILSEYDLLTLKDINYEIEVEEDGKTFEENSMKKAKEISEATGMPCIADDSGLCIESFQGWPGVYSARFLGDEATSEDRNNAILEKMKNLKSEERNARFMCAVTYYYKGECITKVGEIKGKIAVAARGKNNFGFDPIFELEDGRTLAELTKEEKNSISHRKQALEQLLEYLDADKK